MEQQMEDLIQAVNHFKERYHGDDVTRGKVAPVVLCTHSSVAHIGMMTALKNYNLNQKVDGMICMSGVYNLETVRKLEMENGSQNISPMGPASQEKLKEYSPVHMLLESTIMEQAESTLDSFPPLLLLHGKDDEVAPYHFSIELHSVLEKYHPHVDVELEVLDGVGHQDTVLETCLGKGRTQSIIFVWLDDRIWNNRRNY
jgi:alpha-beta hydrolase superfamily lysophospholipase